MPANLQNSLAAAYQARADLLAQLHAEQTNAYRLFHGDVEGEAGLCVDRYGSALLVQSFRRPLTPEQLAALQAFYASAFPGLPVFYNERSQSKSKINNTLPDEQIADAHTLRQFQEMGVNYHFQARHAGLDPWVSLDVRAVRRRVMQEVERKSLLNLFATTCALGIAAAKVNARHVVNVEALEANIHIGKENARLNELPIRVRFVQNDAFAALRQLSGQGQAQMVRGKRMPPFAKMEPHQFNIVVLDPPRSAKSLFGVVDQVNDYAAIFKPALLCTEEGGMMICTNRAAETAPEAWLDQLERSARKAGRAINEAEWITPEADFPSPETAAPLKILLLRV